MDGFDSRYPTRILEALLKDRTTGRNIIWADDEYEALGDGYMGDDEITVEKITGLSSGVIKPRIAKEQQHQSQRTRTRAEVFTPSWLCNRMNNDLDAAWFGVRDTFNVEDGIMWRVNPEPVAFPRRKGRGWHAYVESPRLEITCGEAPFVCSRYDTVTGEALPVGERIGFLDRKLRVVSEKTRSRREWMRWALAALKASYGFEYQGDNLLLARINVFETFCEHLRERWGAGISEEELDKAAWVVSWNFWQMNGLTGAVPSNKMDVIVQSSLFCYEEPVQPTIFDLLDDSFFEETTEKARDETHAETVPLCVIYDWQKNEPYEFASMKGKALDMGKKFYAVIGNPPYQEEIQGSSDKPIYNYFMDECYKVSDRVELITPGRFLFNAGKTSKDWNRRMLNDPHLEVLNYEQVSSNVFPNTDIKGGVAVTLRDGTRELKPIEVFTPFAELRSIKMKISPSLDAGSITDIIHLQERFNLDELYKDYPEAIGIISSDGRERRIVTSSFNKLKVFTDSWHTDDSIRILGLSQPGNKRIYKWIKRKYIEDNGNLECYKVILPKSNGSGALGEVLSTPLIGEPLIGYTQSFLGIGAYDSRLEAEAVLKYVKSKFARVLLGILKITQDNPPEKWKYVPLQDFTSSSDIDWSKSIAEIDQQLYAKYDLSDEEIDFIETHVKEMD
mgnify:FL=1|jgi:hypothetical protein